MNKKLVFLSIVIMLACSVIYIIFVQDKHRTEPSEYKLNDIEEYELLSETRDMLGMLAMRDGSTVSVQTIADDSYDVLYTSNEEAIGIYKAMISDKLFGVNFFPNDDVIYAFGKDKPVNIMFGAPATESGDTYDSPLYIGYYDGTCEYPAEFDYVRSKKKCSQYLQDTLDFVGYSTVDEMLEDVFGQYITKDEN
ncbi:hypothetical protein R2F61_09205 [Mollicutes bacterium LVI A0078]|nr:hypothetical protein RZE84_08980 [Mollicutes bacterium LVI A0075]WOO90875.1 hypothetical protein R2F61_09205 [Mollicutes bacterium LVI A0078]